MSLAPAQDRLKLPESLRNQLLAFRSRVWTIKLIEAVAAAVFGLVVAFLVMFVIDRVWETPVWTRAALFVAAWVGFAILPLSVYRWVWRNRRLDQLARLLSRTQPRIGDQLLGVIELVRSDSEQARSRELCEAAIDQVAQDASKRDFRSAVPRPRHRLWGYLVGVPALVSLVLLAVCPQAVTNAWKRMIAPWSDTPRYTFAGIEPLPATMVVAHGEPFPVSAKLREDTVWKPREGEVQIGSQLPLTSPLRGDAYQFEIPAQIDSSRLDLRIGDSVHHVQIKPTPRPELTTVVADIALPDYLGRPGLLHKDVRGGAVSLVKGAKATFSATASRDLSTAQVDGRTREPAGPTVSSEPVVVDAPRNMEFRWQDTFGLEGQVPFQLVITSRDDEAPSLSCENMPRQKVVLDTEVLNFQVKAHDDFGIQRIGMEWQGEESPMIASPAKGERVLIAGGPDKESLEAAGTFSAKALGIEPQPVNVRIFTEDYLPGRGRVYSPTYTLYVLNAEQHAIWLTEQLSKWHRQSLEVRDRELQLFETNKQLRALNAEELDRPENRRRIDTQSQAERANGRRLSNLVIGGEDLVQQAMRNPEFGVGHLEKWAEMLQILKDISANRMPSVADLLKQASEAPALAMNTSQSPPKTAGQIRSSAQGKPGETKPGPKQPTAPTLVDQESSQLSPDENQKEGKPSSSKPKGSVLRLPVTTLVGPGKKGEEEEKKPAEQQQLDEAVRQQQDLLAEFEKISEELNRVLANLEGSTLVKRLKAASRDQYNIGGRIIDQVGSAFGSGSAPAPAATVLKTLSEQEAKGSQVVSVIMDDLQAYFDRRRFMQFKSVLDEMRKLDVVGALRTLGDELKKENGLAIAQTEYWSDTLDRWAEDLVDPACSGSCPGGRTPDSLPPSIVLEVLQILESEVNLREETRVAEQARSAITSEEHGKQAKGLSQTQDGLRDRVEKVVDRIRELKDAETQFAKEIALLGMVAKVMAEATEILASEQTGPPAIAAETEAIELLLKSKRINPKGGGGGGGANPGGGGSGTTVDSALALLGSGVNQKEVREDHGVSQATGESGKVLPEEFRSGLDEYFNRLERPSGGQ